MKVKRLGTEITSNEALQSKAQHQASRVVRTSECLNDTTWQNKYCDVHAMEKTLLGSVQALGLRVPVS
jgi:hypothetical protein